MLSKKMAFSLMSLITIIALAFVTVPVMAADDFDVTFSWDSTVRESDIEVTVTFGANVGLTNAQAAKIQVRIIEADGTEATHEITGAPANSPSTFPDDYGLSVKDMDPNRNGVQTEGKVFTFDIPAAQTSDGDTTNNNTSAVKTSSIQLFLAAGVETADLTDDKSSKKGSASIGLTDAVSSTVRAALPKVVSVQRLRPGSQTVVAAFQEEVVTDASFNVRIVLTEHPHGPDPLNAANLVDVENGVPSNLVVGRTFSRIGPNAQAATPPTAGEQAQTILPHPIEGMYWHDNSPASGLAGVPRPAGNADANANNLVPLPTSDDNLYRQYRVTITPHSKKGDPSKTFNVKIKVKNFHDNGSTVRNTYVSPGFGETSRIANGRDILTVKVAYTSVNLKAGYRVSIPKEKYIPAGGYLIITKNLANSEVVEGYGRDEPLKWRIKDAPRAPRRTPEQLKYNAVTAADLPNLATQFLNGVVVDVESDNKLYITEVMWGEDVSLNPSSNSQWIELYNPGGGFNTPDDKAETPNIDERLTLVFYAPNEFSSVPAAGADGTLPGRVTDRVGTLDAKGAYWSPSDKGKSGRSGTGEAETVEGRTTPVAMPIVSMYRGMVPDTSAGAAADAMMPADGQMAANWMSSAGPKSANFDPTALGIRHGTPGATTDAIDTPADTAAETKAKEDKAKAAADAIASTGTYPQKGDGRVYISEIMFDGGGRLPQWIEISNGDRLKEFNLSGWTLTVDNAATDTDVDVSSATFTIPDETTIAPSKAHNPAGGNTPSTILVVTETGRNSFTRPKEAAQIINLAVDNEVELITAGVLKGKYTLLSAEAFMITLTPPVPKPEKAPAGETAAAKTVRLANAAKEAALRTAATDTVGNLGKGWTLETNEDGPRSSIIRAHIEVVRGPAAPEDGMMEDNWKLASDTSFANVPLQVSSYYGASSDLGTPGFRPGGALPVELSHFRPARDKATGTVVITWATQSELNNAGFFIKRSQQRNGEFKVINATMIAGAGTTSEKQFYTYTDTTAQPNVVYYYQIEDVSLDGNRQTLTRGIRLKGHIGAAGKATTLWGELKTSHE